jgi:hypothetical protein
MRYRVKVIAGTHGNHRIESIPYPTMEAAIASAQEWISQGRFTQVAEVYPGGQVRITHTAQWVAGRLELIEEE